MKLLPAMIINLLQMVALGKRFFAIKLTMEVFKKSGQM